MSKHARKESPRGKKFLVCVDGSEQASKAIERAFDLYDSRRGDQIVVVACQVPAHTGVEEDEPKHEAIARKAVEELVQGYDAVLKGAGVKYALRGEVGDPREVVVEMCGDIDIDFVICGQRGLTGLKRVLMGSVSRYIADYAPCSVIIAK